MNFFRPQAREAVWRWREVIIGAAVTALGANWAFTGFGLLRWLGWVVLVFGLALLMAGLQRARVRPVTGGVGVVDLDEAQLSYFRPEGGVIVPLSQVGRIEIETTPDAAMTWVFTLRDGQRARIPASAVGGERLLDALSHFPGAQYRNVIEASAAEAAQRFVIWQRHTLRLH
ncbi:hypothetical protein U5922_009500 [Aquicoccus sp. G2-2]|uniref:hypothetical protein n=1 Tax=Aquicoccus sp. G2-2 TaxID=3092120 RepID=UPI002AE067C9|nr:hypothetical protein [Aquicoccus sp. G2-2]MEA1113701.1 hypothetical protein [Aquicoccus sp. G2-2]